MATSSIFAPVVIRGRKAQKRFLAAIEKSAQHIDKPMKKSWHEATDEDFQKWREYYNGKK